MAKKKVTLVNFVLDETGSMDACLDATISGFNEYVDTLARSGEKFLLTLTKFNASKIEVVADAVPLDKVPRLNRSNYVPVEMTPLYDAIARSIRRTEESLNKLDKKTAVLCVIMTDGEENASREYTRQGIFDLITKKTEEGWTFAYLGANQDAWRVGQSIGVHAGNTKGYSTSDTQDTFRSTAAATVTYASTAAPTDKFWIEDES